MKLYKDNLGKVAITVEQGYWNETKDYDKLTVVEREGIFGTYISRKPVPAGTDLSDRTYWIPFSSLKEEIVINYNEFISHYGPMLDDQAEVLNDIQILINEIYSKLPSGITFEGNKTFIRPGYPEQLTLTGTTVNGDPAVFKLYKNSKLVHNVTASSFTYTETVGDECAYKLIVEQSGYRYVAGWNITLRYPIYAGSGTTYGDIISDDNIIKIDTNPEGLYIINVANDGEYIFFVAPKKSIIHSVKLNGLEIPLKQTEEVEIETEYIVYQSDNTYETNNYPIYINSYEGLNGDDFVKILDVLQDKVSSEDIERVSSENLEIKQTLQGIKEENNSINNNIDNAISVIEQYKTEINNSLGIIDNISSATDKITEDIAGNTVDINSLKTNVSSINTSINQLSTSINNINDTMFNEITNLYDELNRVKEDKVDIIPTPDHPKGRIYLKPNWTVVDFDNGERKVVPVITHESFLYENTTYVLDYDFYCIDEDIINIPDNCVLEFRNGSIVRCDTILYLNNAIINDCGNCNIFKSVYNIVFYTNVIYIDWFFEFLNNYPEIELSEISQITNIDYFYFKIKRHCSLNINSDFNYNGCTLDANKKEIRINRGSVDINIINADVYLNSEDINSNININVNNCNIYEFYAGCFSFYINVNNCIIFNDVVLSYSDTDVPYSQLIIENNNFAISVEKVETNASNCIIKNNIFNTITALMLGNVITSTYNVIENNIINNYDNSNTINNLYYLPITPILGKGNNYYINNQLCNIIPLNTDASDGSTYLGNLFDIKNSDILLSMFSYIDVDGVEIALNFFKSTVFCVNCKIKIDNQEETCYCCDSVISLRNCIINGTIDFARITSTVLLENTIMPVDESYMEPINGTYGNILVRYISGTIVMSNNRRFGIAIGNSTSTTTEGLANEIIWFN